MENVAFDNLYDEGVQRGSRKFSALVAFLGARYGAAKASRAFTV